MKIGAAPQGRTCGTTYTSALPSEGVAAGRRGPPRASPGPPRAPPGRGDPAPMLATRLFGVIEGFDGLPFAAPIAALLSDGPNHPADHWGVFLDGLEALLAGP